MGKYPPLTPLTELPDFRTVQEIGRYWYRSFTSKGGVSATSYTTIFTCPAGKRLILWEIYSVARQITSDPSGIVAIAPSGQIIARIPVTSTGGVAYGSTNYIVNTPITIIEGESFALEYTAADALSYLLMSLLIEMKDKNG